jgi:glycine cleavage system H lipoate-binding protein
LLLKIVQQSGQKTNKQIAKTRQLEELESQKNFENKILQDKVSQLEARLIEANSELADARSKLNEKDNELLEIQRK